jgi:hypothetical protein
MPAYNTKQILNQLIIDLPFSEDFTIVCTKIRVNIIGEMTAIPVADLIKSQRFYLSRIAGVGPISCEE